MLDLWKFKLSLSRSPRATKFEKKHPEVTNDSGKAEHVEDFECFTSGSLNSPWHTLMKPRSGKITKSYKATPPKPAGAWEPPKKDIGHVPLTVSQGLCVG